MVKQDIDRYARQLVLKEIGSLGQARLASSSVLIAGCGALGGTQAHLLVRAGVGRVKLVDSDKPEPSNLPRQLLYDERDVASGCYKAERAAEKLALVNAHCKLEPMVVRIRPENVENLICDVDVVLDATDNFETRYLINDACVKHKKPWVYGGILGTSGMSLTIFPGLGACLVCLFPSMPRQNASNDPESVGILNAAPALVAALQTTEALKILVGKHEASGDLVTVDLWGRVFRKLAVARDDSCKCCVEREFRYLGGMGPPL